MRCVFFSKNGIHAILIIIIHIIFQIWKDILKDSKLKSKESFVSRFTLITMNLDICAHNKALSFFCVYLTKKSACQIVIARQETSNHNPISTLVTTHPENSWQNISTTVQLLFQLFTLLLVILSGQINYSSTYFFFLFLPALLLHIVTQMPQEVHSWGPAAMLSQR